MNLALIKPLNPRLALAGIAACLFSLSPLSAAEINATVESAAGKSATLQTDSSLLPSLGDKVKIYFKLPGTDDEISVAEGAVVETAGDRIKVEIKEATGTVEKNQLARIDSTKPQAKAQGDAGQLPLPPIAGSEPTEVGQMAARTVTFDELPAGKIPDGAFAGEGLQFLTKKGHPEVFDTQPNMVLPAPCRKVMLVTGGPTTSLTIRLDPPAKRFALYRAGAVQGASIPTWKMTAFDRKGKVIGSSGETRGLPTRPRYFGIDAEGIALIELTTDNRQGQSTWATWNSLPVAGFGFDR